MLPNELSIIRKFASWNGFPKNIVNGIIKRSLQVKDKPTEKDDNKVVTIWVKLCYHGNKSQQLIRNLERKVRRFTTKDVKLIFKTTYTTTKLCFYTNTKDRTPKQFKSNVVYHFRCPGCSDDYIGKTDRNIYERCYEHATTKTAVSEHISKCPGFEHITTLLRNDLDDLTDDDLRHYLINSVFDNTKIIDSSNNWNILLLKEALYIKRKMPVLNNGLKASKELYLFS